MKLRQVVSFLASGLVVSIAGLAATDSVLAQQPVGSTTAQATTPATVCRRILPTPVIVQAKGVLLRSQPTQRSQIAGLGYAPGEQFQTTRKTVKSEGLIWLEVKSPRAGWVWAGSGDKITNIGNCP